MFCVSISRRTNNAVLMDLLILTRIEYYKFELTDTNLLAYTYMCTQNRDVKRLCALNINRIVEFTVSEATSFFSRKLITKWNVKKKKTVNRVAFLLSSCTQKYYFFFCNVIFTSRWGFRNRFKPPENENSSSVRSRHQIQ